MSCASCIATAPPHDHMLELEGAIVAASPRSHLRFFPPSVQPTMAEENDTASVPLPCDVMEDEGGMADPLPSNVMEEDGHDADVPPSDVSANVTHLPSTVCGFPGCLLLLYLLSPAYF